MKTNKIAFWGVGGAALLFNLWGVWNAYCYFFTSPEKMMEKMMAMKPDMPHDKAQAMVDFFSNLPWWYNTIYAIAILAGILAAVLLLARRQLAAPLFLASAVGAAITFISDYFLGAFTMMAEMEPKMVTMMGVMEVAVVLVLLFFWWWSKKMATRGDIV